MSIPSLVALLFFLVGLFVPTSRSVPSMTSLLFFPMGLFVLYALSGKALFFPLGLFVFAIPSIVNPFFFPIGLFVFQIGGLVTPMSMCIFNSEYVTL